MMASELGSSENSDLLTGSIRNHSSSLAPKKDDGREEVRERHAQLKEYINILDKKMHKIV